MNLTCFKLFLVTSNLPNNRVPQTLYEVYAFRSPHFTAKSEQDSLRRRGPSQLVGHNLQWRWQDDERDEWMEFFAKVDSRFLYANNIDFLTLNYRSGWNNQRITNGLCWSRKSHSQVNQYSISKDIALNKSKQMGTHWRVKIWAGLIGFAQI